MKQTKNIIITILVILLICFGVNYLMDLKENIVIESYNKGYEYGSLDTTQNIAIQQTNTGNILIVDNNTIISININQLCGGGQ